MSLEAAEAWLQHTTSQTSEGLARYLDGLTLEWLVDGLVGKEKVLQERVGDGAALKILSEHLYRHAGMDAAKNAQAAPLLAAGGNEGLW